MKYEQSKIDRLVTQILKEELNKKSEEVSEKLHGNQNKLDVAKPKGVLNKKDFEMLRKGKKKEQKEEDDSETSEGNAFSGARAKAIKKGEKSFEVDGETYPVKESEDKWIQKTGMKKGALRKKLGIPEGEKIPKSKLNSLKKELMKKSEGDKKLSPPDSKLLKQVNLALTLDTVKENVSSLKLTENELIDLIESIVLEQNTTKLPSTENNISIKKPIGLTTVDKANRKTREISDENTKNVTKKMNDYLKDGSKEKYNPNPKHFPMGNGELGEMKKKAYIPSKVAKEYIDNLAYPGLENNVYDEIHPNEEWLEKNLVGSSETGNNHDWANAVDTGVDKKFNKKRKENLIGKEKLRSYNRVTQPVDEPGGDESSADNKKLNNIFKQLESVDVKKEKVLKEEMDKMKKFIQYKDKTQ